MTVPVPTEQPPDSASESALDGRDVTSETAIPANEGPATSANTGLRTGEGGGGRGVQREFARYVVVGGIAFAGDTCTLYSLTQFLRVNYLVSAAVGFTLGLGVNYLLSRTWVFERRRLKNTSVEMTIFALIGVVGLGLNELILWFFQAKLGVFYLFAKGVSGGVVLVWNFAARKLTLFS